MEVLWFKHLPSTHKYIIENIKDGAIVPPIAVGVDFQSSGVGSRGNTWEGDEGNLYFSFCVKEKHLPKDLKLESISIYFSWIMRDILYELGSKTWIKWPNDLYIKKSKIGGVITTKIKDMIIGSIGINILHAPEQFATLDINITPQKLVEIFIKKLEEKISWKNVFSKYKIEFQNNLGFTFHLDGKKKSLADAKLFSDGSIQIENRRVYSLR